MKKIKPTTYGAGLKFDFKNYSDKVAGSMTAADKEWIEQFYNEYYNDLVDFLPKEQLITKANEHIKEARRNYNALKTDALELAAQKKLSSVDYTENEEFLEAASDAWEWRDSFKVGGYELAVQTIFLLTIRDLKNDSDWMPILARMSVLMNELRKMQKRQYQKHETKNQGKIK